MSAHRRARAFALLPALALFTFPEHAQAVPSFARQTGFPCSQCHTLSFGPAEHPLPLALMVQGGLSRSEAPQPAPPAPHFGSNDNLSIDQVSLFLATRLSDHIGMFSQATYSGDARHLNWDNTDIRWARPVSWRG